MPGMAWWTPSPFRRQSRRTFQALMRAKACCDAGADRAVGAVVPFLQAGSSV
ncbi:hypothetical protein GCM10023329_40570 [Streptomyces sanyensis]|uniref:Uncharacterized protein n=1 Tax=Streptomyces sanyensis TaxID=568869 RepID=A0ABP9ATQ6_9ACTN